jgi:hypothetical protein
MTAVARPSAAVELREPIRTRVLRHALLSVNRM